MQVENRYYYGANHEKDPKQSHNVRRHDLLSLDGSDDLEFKFSVKQNVKFGSSDFEPLYREAGGSQSPGLLQPWVTD